MPQAPKAKDVEEVMAASSEEEEVETVDEPVATDTTHYRFVGRHAEVVHKMDGTLPHVGPGDYIDLGPDDLANNSNVAVVPFLIDATGQ